MFYQGDRPSHFGEPGQSGEYPAPGKLRLNSKTGITFGLVFALFLGLQLGCGSSKPEPPPIPEGPPLEAHTLMVKPPQASFDLTIIPVKNRINLETSGNAGATIEMLPTDKLRVVAKTLDGLYLPMDQEFTYDQLKSNDWTVSLEPVTADTMLEQVTKFASEGKWDNSAIFFFRSAAIHPELRTKMVSTSLELRGIPTAATHQLGDRYLATAIVGNGSTNLSVVPTDQAPSEVKSQEITHLPQQIYLLKGMPWAVLIFDNSVSVMSLDPNNTSYDINFNTPEGSQEKLITSSAISPDAGSILVGRSDHSVDLLSVGTGAQPVAPTGSAKFSTKVDAVGIDPNGKYGFAMGSNGDGRRWPLSDFQDSSAFDFQIKGLEEEVLAIVPLASDRLFVFTTTKLWDVRIFNKIRTAIVEKAAEMQAPVLLSRLTPDGRFLIFNTISAVQPLSIVSTDVTKSVDLLPPGVAGNVEDFDISSDSQWLVYVNKNGALSAIDLTSKSRKSRQLLPPQGEHVKYVRLSENDTHVLTVTRDGTVTWWNFPQLEFAAQLNGRSP